MTAAGMRDAWCASHTRLQLQLRLRPPGDFLVAHISFFPLQACEDESHLAQSASISSCPEAIHRDLQGQRGEPVPLRFVPLHFDARSLPFCMSLFARLISTRIPPLPVDLVSGQRARNSAISTAPRLISLRLVSVFPTRLCSNSINDYNK